MVRFVSCNVQKDYNFGGPCLLFGLNELLECLYHDEYILENVQAGFEDGAVNDDLPVNTVYYYPLSKKHFFRFLFGYKNCMGLFGLLRYLRHFDVVIDLFGICFCDNLDKGGAGILNNRWRDLKKFTVSILAKKILKKTVVKNTASYGPMEEACNRYSAVFMCTHVFDKISARERESAALLKNILIQERKIILSPDTANLMPYDKTEGEHDEIIVSVSHMMKKQWKAGEDYVLCMSKFIRKVVKDYNAKAGILPNECNPGYYNDINVAEEIFSEIRDLSGPVRIIDAKNMSCWEIKNEIVSSKALVGSRYHSCVAALSAGVPVLIIGWHDKYEELLRNYGQEEWLLSNFDCSYEKLVEKFERLLKRIDEERMIIEERGREVKYKVFEAGRVLYENS